MAALSGQEVQFTLNGELHSVNVDEASGKTLNQYIRFNTQHTGTKLSCGQGGCGACTVTLVKDSQPLKSVASCITPLAAVHGAAVITVEGLAKDGVPHPVSERLAKFGGSQCGFCTPGMVMQLYSTLSKEDGGKSIAENDLEGCINGNICRCTGYRPIIECAKSFAANSKVKNQFDPSAPVGPYDVASMDPKIVLPSKAPLCGKTWVRPFTVSEVLTAMAEGAVPIAGGTAGGVYAELTVTAARAAGTTFVDLGAVDELRTITSSENQLKIGATVTWTVFVEYLKQLVSKGTKNDKAITELQKRCSAIAGPQVRNSGTIGGNIAITRNKGFASDWVPPLIALGARVQCCDQFGRESTVDLIEFVTDENPFVGLILSVTLPLPESEVVFKSYRVAGRSVNAHALVNAAFSASIVGGKIAQSTMVLGAVDHKPVRLKQTERALQGMTGADLESGLPSVLASLSEKVTADLFSMTCAYGRDQTAHIICGFLVKFLTSTFPASVPKDWQSSEYCLHDMPRSTEAEQLFPPPLDIGGALNMPSAKTSALQQTMGRAKFTDDMPKPVNTLIGALVLCPEAGVTVDDIDITAAKGLLGNKFHSLVTSCDLKTPTIAAADLLGMGGMPPKYKDNFESSTYLLLPFGTPSTYGGQPVALLLAHGDDPKLVEHAAKVCTSGVKFTRTENVIIGDLQNSPDVADLLTFTKGKKSASEVVNKAKESGVGYLTGKFTKKSQAHFAIEGQSVLVIPDEEGVTCHIACQGPDGIQKAICAATGLQQSKVAVMMRRVGGGFGGKIFYTVGLASLASQVAIAKDLPVRVVLPREIEMSCVGGRPEYEATWQVAVDMATGKISALDYEIWQTHSARGENIQRFYPHAIGAAIDECYGIPDMAVTFHLVKQNVVDRTAVRGPGHYEASLLMEAVLDGVSSALDLPGCLVRENNFFRGKSNTSGLNGGALPQGTLDDYSNLALWALMKQKCSYETRLQDIKEFNRNNAWKKRGFSMTPARYGCFLAPGNSARVDIFKDGSVQVAVSGAEIGQGLHTKVGQMVSTVFARALGAGPPLDCIRFLPTSTEHTPNGTITGGSTTSEASMFAAGEACRQLVQTLKPHAAAAKKVTEKDPRGLWFDILKTSFSTKFMGILDIPPHLSATGMHYPYVPETMIETYGVGAAEVELDVLTGEHRVLFTKLIFDIGMSYNPLVDIGQMEGAFIMGMGNVMQEGVEMDPSTGKLITDNTWTYKPPVAWDVPEKFQVELVDMTKSRLNNPVGGCLKPVIGGLMGCLGVPWKPIKTEKILKSAKAIGEPPALLSAAVQSALHSAMVAASRAPLPDHMLPMPAKPFVLLPRLQGQKPGSGSGPDDASTATGTSASSVARKL